MQTTKTIDLFINHDREGTYFTVPFTMPAETESFTLSYRYDRRGENESQAGAGRFVAQPEINIIDLGLITPDGSQAGASGSDKTEITVSETWATPGYLRQPLVPGEWEILVGAYHIAPEGVQVTYELTFTGKSVRLLKGDLHTHTLASDGVLSVKELGKRARRHDLDFLAITDHNQFAVSAAFPEIPGLTLIPGVEWTHYQGHANFLGVDRPFDAPFMSNSLEEAQQRFLSARERGALITVNHPFEEVCPFRFDLDALPFDCLEVWNGPRWESNLRALGLWQSLLAGGKKIPMYGGSDYHRDTPFIFLGGPTTCVYARSAGASDILAALRQGHSYVIFAPNGPSLEMKAGEASLGDTVRWSEEREVEITAEGLQTGDVIRVVTPTETTPILQAPAPGRFQARYAMQRPGFVRIEILRAFVPGLPLLPALLSNPIFFEEG